MGKIKSYIITIPKPKPLLLHPWVLDETTKNILKAIGFYEQNNKA